MATTAARRWCHITVTISIEYQNNTGNLNANQFQTLINGWETAIENMWNGPNGRQRFRCCIVSFNVITRIGNGTNGFHQVNVVAGPQTSVVCGLGPQSRNARWDAQDTGNVTAHETGHLLGLPDEYDYGGPNGVYRNLNPQPAGQPESIMAQTWGTIAALQEHIDAIIGNLGMRCPWWCCWFKWFRWFFTRRARVLKLNTEQAKFEETLISIKNMPANEILKLVEKGKPDAIALAVDELIRRGKDSVSELLATAKGQNVISKWVAITVLGEMKDRDVLPQLRVGLEDKNISIRIASAQSYAKLGHTEGIEVLIDALSSDEVIIGHPPQLACQYAHSALKSITKQDIQFEPDPSKREMCIDSWKGWWHKNKETFKIE